MPFSAAEKEKLTSSQTLDLLGKKRNVCGYRGAGRVELADLMYKGRVVMLRKASE